MAGKKWSNRPCDGGKEIFPMQGYFCDPYVWPNWSSIYLFLPQSLVSRAHPFMCALTQLWLLNARLNLQLQTTYIEDHIPASLWAEVEGRSCELSVAIGWLGFFLMESYLFTRVQVCLYFSSKNYFKIQRCYSFSGTRHTYYRHETPVVDFINFKICQVSLLEMLIIIGFTCMWS
jgi:hypothetical protein